MSTAPNTARIAVIGGGPAGLMAAEVLARAGHRVDVYDAMPSVGRKFLLAGVGGMNITHSEPLEQLLDRYGNARPELEAMVRPFDADALRAWIHGLGIETFVGTSGRVFPREMKAAPLLRAWLTRLKAAGVAFHVRHRWLGWNEHGALLLTGPDGDITVQPDATVLALGGASWPRLGSDGGWVPLLAARGIAIAPLQPANCGFDVGWSPWFADKHAGQPLKAVVLHHDDWQRQGEFVVTASGIEGSLIYAASARLRDAIARDGHATVTLDLAPGRTLERLTAELAAPRGADSMANHLRRKVHIDGVKAGLLRELLPKDTFTDTAALAQAIKALPLRLTAPRPIAEAISSAGGVRWDAMDDQLMLTALPGVFCAGEMLDWEAPTGGYLLTGCFASGRQAGEGVKGWLKGQG
ncbi:MAG TPA: TIGR03862 family flavoprotein [Chitinolyticbacter sp.]|nr:TIGR03862 family flavoprotein [Chitinolyticbacter sp.]